MKPVYTPDRIGDVPNKPATKGRLIRISDNDWADLEAAADGAGTDRSALVKAFIAWYLRRPGAKLPVRPPRKS